MSNIPITPGSGVSSVATETIGGNDYQQVKIVDGTAASTNKWKINADGSAQVSILGTPSVTFSGSPSISGAVTVVGNPSISGQVGASILGFVPVSVMGGTIGISGAVTINSPSVYGNISGSVVGFQGGAWTTSVVGTIAATQSGAWSASVVGGPVTLYAPTASLVSAVSSVITGTASITVLVGAPGGQRNYITHILATNGAATGTFVNIYDGGNVVYSGYAAASGGGFSATLPAPLRQASAQGALCAATSAQGSVIVAVSGYTAT